MSASPVARVAVHHSQHVRSAPRTIVVNCPTEIPEDVSSTPGGTLFSTTPGGTRIVYERNFLLGLRNSPLARSPPKNLPLIPGVTTKEEPNSKPEKPVTIPEVLQEEEEERGDVTHEQFHMEL